MDTLDVWVGWGRQETLVLAATAPLASVRVCRTSVPPWELQNPVYSCCAYS